MKEIDELKDDTWGSPLTGDHEGYPLSGDTEANYDIHHLFRVFRPQDEDIHTG